MADMPPHLYYKLLHFPSHSSRSHFSLPLNLSPLHNSTPLILRRRLSLSSLLPKLSSPSNSPNILLISTSVQSDGSLVFKFGDASEIPTTIEKADICDTVSDNAGIKAELGIESDKTVAKDSVECEVIATESELDSVEILDVVVVEVEDSAADKAVEIGNVVTTNDDSEREESDVVSEIGFDVEKSDSEVVLESIIDGSGGEESDVVSEIGFDVEKSDSEVVVESKGIDVDEEVVQEMELPLVQLEAEPILDEEVDDATSPAIVESDIYLSADNKLETVDPEESQMISTEANLDSVIGVEYPASGDSMLQEAISSPLPLEVNDAGPPSVAGVEESSTGECARAGFPSLEASVISSTETATDREDINSHNGDISTLSLSMSSAAASLSHPFEECHSSLTKLPSVLAQLKIPIFQTMIRPYVNDAASSSILHTDDNTESADISEPADSDLKSSGKASTEISLNSERTSKAAVLVPSVTTSLPHPIEVNDAANPCIQQSDDDLQTDISVAADLGPGISGTAETSLREELSVPSLSLVSAAASLAHLAEAVAGGDDAYFVFENWFGVADGVGQWSFGGIDKGLYAQEFIHNCEKLARMSQNTGLSSFKELLQKSGAMTESTGAARVLIAHIADKVLHVANIGDSGFVIIRDGSVFKKSSPMFHEFNFPYAISSGDNPVEAIEEYHIELEDGDVIVTATDGLFDNLYEHEIASLVIKTLEDGKTLKDLAELLAFRAQEVGTSPHARTPFADAAQAAGHTEFNGGKYDHVTVIVSEVRKE